MPKDWMPIQGFVVEGFRVASAPSNAYPYGTIEKQKPIFKARGLDLSPFFNGTLNISIAPYIYKMLKPEYTFEKVEWTDLHPPETFSFSQCKLIYEGREYDGWIYYPHPGTKKTHFQEPSVIEIITHEITGIKYGDRVELLINSNEITIQK